MTTVTKMKSMPSARRLRDAAAPFARVANIIDALPNANTVSDIRSLLEFMPGAWPTVGDVRRLRDELVRMGWKP